MSSEAQQGRIKFFCFEKGYGFIRHPDGDVFLHASELPHLYLPMQGDLIGYATKRTRKGSVAVQVKFISRADNCRHLDFTPPIYVTAASPSTNIGGQRE